MANYNVYKSSKSLADAYGYDMTLYGKSQYWSSPRVCEDTTSDLTSCSYFKSLSPEDQTKMLEYGYLCYRYGMGCYQERGGNVAIYDKYVFKGGPPNPFNNEKSNTKKESSNDDMQPGM